MPVFFLFFIEKGNININILYNIISKLETQHKKQLLFVNSVDLYRLKYYIHDDRA